MTRNSLHTLQTVNGHFCRTFQEAYQSLGLLEDDQEIDKVMEEAASIQLGPALRNTFMTILIHCTSANPLQFWETHKVNLCTDLMQRDKVSSPTEAIINEVLLDVHEKYGLPKLQSMSQSLQNTTPRVIEEELSYNTSYLQGKVTEQYRTLNKQQHHGFSEQFQGESVLHDCMWGQQQNLHHQSSTSSSASSRWHCTGDCLIRYCTTLLNNGRTPHSRCRLPIKIDENSMCSITKKELLSQLLRQTKLLVIDEVTMGHCYIFEAVDRTMMDIRE